jgi:hypothetical protein
MNRELYYETGCLGGIGRYAGCQLTACTLFAADNITSIRTHRRITTGGRTMLSLCSRGIRWPRLSLCQRGNFQMRDWLTGQPNYEIESDKHQTFHVV